MVSAGTNKPSASQPKAEVKAVEKIVERPYFLIVHRQTKQDPWSHKGVGQEFFRNKDFAQQAIPPNATESYIIEITLPI